MITKDTLKTVLKYFGFSEANDIMKKEYANGASIEVNFNKQKIIYAPIDKDFGNGEYPTKDKPAKGFIIHRDTTLDFKAKENFVCLVCVHLLLAKGYEAKHIVFEPAFKVGHVNKPSYGDILVFNKEYNPLVLIENKTYGSEFSKEWNNMQKNGGQLFSYLGPLINELGFCENLVLFAADFDEKEILKSHIITLKDNEKRIADLENPKTFQNAQGKYYDVWNETYGKSFETKGLFENDIEAYSIGKLKYTISDLKELSHAEIKPIYHEFATILRNHAITDFEHSFYILIDLFLCKITDERNNPNDLQFYYKGISRDTPKEYCTRLLKLYQEGKRDLFHIEVVNKEESDIKQIFEDTNRSVTNGLYAGIKELFEEIKFYNIKKFNFIDVENKEDFEKNFQILIKIAALIQDISLSNSETNHFFGDLFEGLLSKNVHQTEGQFFTPLPIVNFIINSLPEFPKSENIKVLDYACGAGHFLTEFIKGYPNANVFGIEKSPNLSQVAKIAAIINGGRDPHIVSKDALSIFNTDEIRYQGFDKESFDCIIANPPYSVKKFLETIDSKDRSQFDLIQSVDENSYETNNSIECFFVERTKYFLRPYGIMGIILPSSILSNGNLYIKTREILFAHFNILAIVNMGSRTFGSTGTNTIVLFAQRVKKNSEGLLDTFIKKQDYTQYLSWQSIDNYIQKQGYDQDDYFLFMQDDELNETLENHEIFVDYKRNFKPSPIKKNTQIEWFKESHYFNEDLIEGTKDFRKQFLEYLESNAYKFEEENEKHRQFIKFAQTIECNKLNTFIQIENNEIVILQSPADKVNNKSNKAQIVKFLGYDWSNRKGDEGIQYITKREEKTTEDDFTEEDDKEASINSIKFIDTQLYNPNDTWDSSKFAFAIRKHIYEQCRKFSFGENKKAINTDYNGDMNELLSYAKLSDMVDFSRTDFDKAIKLTTDKKIEIKSKFPLELFSNIVSTIETGSRPSGGVGMISNGVLSLGGEHIDKSSGYLNLSTPKYVSDDFYNSTTKGKLKKGDLLICKDGALTGKVAMVRNELEGKDAMINEHVFIVRCKEMTTQYYLFELLYSEIGQNLLKANITGSAQGGLNSTNLKTIKIPLPPIDIQQQIVSECEKVDEEYKNSRKIIKNQQKMLSEIHLQGNQMLISDVCTELFAGGDKPKEFSDTKTEEYSIPVYANGIEKEGLVGFTNRYRVNQNAVTISGRGTLGFACIRTTPFFPIVRLIVAIPNGEIIHLKYFKFAISKLQFENTGGTIPQLTVPNFGKMAIPVPSLSEQQRIVSEIESYEAEIAKAKAVMDGCAERKKQILDKWLN